VSSSNDEESQADDNDDDDDDDDDEIYNDGDDDADNRDNHHDQDGDVNGEESSQDSSKRQCTDSASGESSPQAVGLRHSPSFILAFSSSGMPSSSSTFKGSDLGPGKGVGLGLTLGHGHGSTLSFLDDYLGGEEGQKMFPALPPLPPLQLLSPEGDPSAMLGTDNNAAAVADDKPRSVSFSYEGKTAAFAVVPLVANEAEGNDDPWGDVLSMLCNDDALCF
jgi:hypothetical protein